jgi:hypothetical protein
VWTLLTAVIMAEASPPNFLHYQGRILSGTSSAPVDGTGYFKFALVNGDGSTRYWGNSPDVSPVDGVPDAAVLLSVSRGLYSVALGDTNIPNMTLPVTASVFSQPDVRLRVWFSAGPNGPFEQFQPDQRMASVGYALVASTVSDGAITSEKLAPGSIGPTALAGGVLTPVPVPAGVFTISNSNGRYAATGSAVTTFDLPTSANPGDTLQITAPGTGGWIARDSSWENWTPRDSTRQWLCLAASADGTKLVAGDYGGQLYTSIDSGLSWVARATSRSWKAVASSADGSVLVAVVDSGQIHVSNDSGVTWSARESNRAWQCVACSADGRNQVAAVNGGVIFGSGDFGNSWLPLDGGTRAWTAVASSDDGTKLVAAVAGGQIYTSHDSGVTWVAQASGSQAWAAVASSADGVRLFAAVNGGAIYRSNDSGASWSPGGSGTNPWSSVASAADGTKLAAVAYPGRIYTSGDAGTTWMATETNRLWTAIASSRDGSKLVASERFGQLFTSGLRIAGGPGVAASLTSLGNGRWALASTLVDQLYVDSVHATHLLMTSDRNQKEQFSPVNPGEILARLAALPVTEWQYKSDVLESRHLGPMAQDFRAAFHLGSDDKQISVIDEGGVALVAIQGLLQKVELENASLRAENAGLQQRMTELEKQVRSLLGRQ